MTHWKKIDPDNLPEGYCLFSFGIPQVCMYGRLENREGEAVLINRLKDTPLIGFPKYFIDPSELPPPGEVKLDWWVNPKLDKQDSQVAIFQGRRFVVFIGVIRDKPGCEYKAYVGNKKLYGGPEQEAAKAACERYAAGLINQESKPEKPE